MSALRSGAPGCVDGRNHVTQNAYLAEIQRGNIIDTVVLADGASPDGSVTPVDSASLASLARTAETKVAKAT